MYKNIITYLFLIAPILGFSQAGDVISSISLNSSTSNIFEGIESTSSIGGALCNIGDLNEDGIIDLAVEYSNGGDNGILILFLNVDGSIKKYQAIYKNHGGLTGSLPSNMEGFGEAIALLGDLDGDGIQDLLVGKPYEGSGEAFVLFMKRDGTVKKFTRIGEFRGGFNVNLHDDEEFGRSVAKLRDFDGDGITEIAIGEDEDPTGGFENGAIYILYLRADGTVKRHKKITENVGGFNTDLDIFARFGSSVCLLDSNSIAVGSIELNGRGSIWILNISDSLNVVSHSRITASIGGLADTLTMGASFGNSISNVGDLNGDNINDLLVGSFWQSDITKNSGAAFLLFMNSNRTVASEYKYSNSSGPIPDSLANRARYGKGVCGLGDFNGDGKLDIAICASSNLVQGSSSQREGRIDLLFLDGFSRASVSNFEVKPFSIYPNPSTGIINLDNDLEIEEVSVTNQYGQEVFHQIGRNIDQVQLPNFTKGIHFVKAISSSQHYYSKLLIY
jgi:hypothetical protein